MTAITRDVSDRCLVVDAMNVIGSRPTGWWRDRDGAVRRLVERLTALAEIAQELVVVVDGRPIPDLPEGDHDGVTVRYAQRRGPDAADDRILQIVRLHPVPAGLTVVTSDRALQAAATALGADVLGAGTFLRHLERLEASG